MPLHTDRPKELAWQVFRGSDVVRRGLLTAYRLRGTEWVRLRRDVYADSRLPQDHRLACRAVALQLPEGAAVAGPSAAYLHGVEHAAGFGDDVHVLVPPRAGIRRQQGLRVHSCSYPHPSPPVRCPPERGDGPPRTDPTQAAWETAVWLEPVLAVGVVDSLLQRGLTTPDALDALLRCNGDRPGGRRARWVFDLADPTARSPTESHLRVRLTLTGLPRPVSRHPVELPSGLAVSAHLAWPEFQVAIRYATSVNPLSGRGDPGDDHLSRAGWLVLPVTARRSQREFPALVQEVRAALTGRGWTGERRRSRLPGRQLGDDRRQFGDGDDLGVGGQVGRAGQARPVEPDRAEPGPSGGDDVVGG